MRGKKAAQAANRRYGDEAQRSTTLALRLQEERAAHQRDVVNLQEENRRLRSEMDQAVETRSAERIKQAEQAADARSAAAEQRFSDRATEAMAFLLNGQLAVPASVANKMASILRVALEPSGGSRAGRRAQLYRPRALADWEQASTHGARDQAYFGRRPEDEPPADVEQDGDVAEPIRDEVRRALDGRQC